MNDLIFLSIVAGVILGLFIISFIESSRTVVKKWELLKNLKEKANSVESKEDISKLHEEMKLFARTTSNEYIHRELQRIDGFLRGLYKNAK